MKKIQIVPKFEFHFQKPEFRSILDLGDFLKKTEISDEKDFHLWVSKNIKNLDYIKNYGRYEDEPKR